MRLVRLTLGLFLIATSILSAQAPAPQADRAAPTPVPLPVRRVVLYKTGVGYFEHLGKVRNRQDVTIRFTSAQLDDVLKSLTTMDLGKGQITGISYNSVAPIEQRLGALRLPLDAQATGLQLLGALRGAHVEVTSASGAATGRVLSVEQRQQVRNGDTAFVDWLAIVTDLGDVRTFELTPSVHVRIVDRDLRQEVGRYLDLIGSTRDQDARGMVISTNGTGERPLFVSYVSEVPIWKTTYRLVLAAKNKPLLQGWAIVDNTIGEDWQNVELSLVAGAPQSFIQHISQPYYGRRPVVSLPSAVQLAPQTHEATLFAKEPPQATVAESITVNSSVAARSRRDSPAGFAGGVVGGVVGGLPNAPPPPSVYERMDEIAPAASGAELGGLFEYKIKDPVTLRKNQSALVPIINSEIEIEKVSLWNRNTGSGHPLRAVWLNNVTGLTLDGGSVSIIEGDAFAGEGLIEPLKPAERRLVSYGSDLGVLVDARADSSTGRILRVRARDGILIQESEERANWIYRIRNQNTTSTTLVVEHAMNSGWKLADGQKPAESTADTQRFRVVVAPGAETTLTVRDVKPGQSRISIANVDETLLVALSKAGVPISAMQAALKPVLEKRAELASLERRLQGLKDQLDEITRDQERLRENMKALARQRRGETAPPALHAPARRAGDEARYAETGDDEDDRRARHGTRAAEHAGRVGVVRSGGCVAMATLKGRPTEERLGAVRRAGL